MQTYTKKYLKALGYDETDFIKCEICEGKATEIHHIMTRKKFRELMNDPRNLMAICRECHQAYGDRKYLMAALLKIHKRVLQIADYKTDYNWFNFYLKKYETARQD